MKSLTKTPITLAALLLGLSCMLESLAINNDGKTDIWWRQSVTGDNSGWIMNGTTYSNSVTMAYNGDTNWKMVGIGPTPPFYGDTGESTIANG